MQLIVSFFLVLVGTPLSADVLTSNNPWGKRADEIQVDVNSIPEPPLSKSKKSYATINKLGFDVFKSESSWISDAFLKDIKPGMVVMDVGAGYGILTRFALAKGATVISNDLADTHLMYNLKKITPEQRSKLYLSNQDIRTLALKNNTLDLIIFHRVLHFFTGNDIGAILAKAHGWLKPGGKIYIVMMSKDHVAFRDKIIYDNSKKWPGENLVIVEKHLPEQAYALPKTLHVISSDTLRNRLGESGFKIERADYVAFKHVGTEPNRDGKEAVGVIAVKE